MDAVLLDLDGVIYQGDSALPGAVATLEWLQDRDIPYLFLTNTTSRPMRSLCAKLEAMGIGCTPDQLLTPAAVARHWLQQQGLRRVASLVAEPTLADLEDLRILAWPQRDSIDALIVGDLAEDWTYDRLNWGFRLLMDNPEATLIALGMTRYCRAGDQLRLDVAPFVAALQAATDRSPLVAGKPGELMFNSALSLLGVEAGRTLMVGDDIRSDVGGALDVGLTGVLVKTGKFRSGDLQGEIRPDAVLSSIADLPEWWSREYD